MSLKKWVSEEVVLVCRAWMVVLQALVHSQSQSLQVDEEVEKHLIHDFQEHHQLVRG